MEGCPAPHITAETQQFWNLYVLLHPKGQLIYTAQDVMSMPNILATAFTTWNNDLGNAQAKN